MLKETVFVSANFNGNKDAHIIQLNRNLYNAPNLRKILENNEVNKIFHFARADLLFLKNI